MPRSEKENLHLQTTVSLLQLQVFNLVEPFSKKNGVRDRAKVENRIVSPKNESSPASRSITHLPFSHESFAIIIGKLKIQKELILKTAGQPFYNLHFGIPSTGYNLYLKTSFLRG